MNGGNGAEPNSAARGPLRAALLGLVTVVALLLYARTHIESLSYRSEYPMMSLQDPVRALLLR